MWTWASWKSALKISCKIKLLITGSGSMSSASKGDIFLVFNSLWMTKSKSCLIVSGCGSWFEFLNTYFCNRFKKKRFNPFLNTPCSFKTLEHSLVVLNWKSIGIGSHLLLKGHFFSFCSPKMSSKHCKQPTCPHGSATGCLNSPDEWKNNNVRWLITR